MNIPNKPKLSLPSSTASKYADHIYLEILEATQLVPMDSNGLSDPYCTFFLSQPGSSSPSSKSPAASPRKRRPSLFHLSSRYGKTHVISKTLNPIWKEAFVIYAPDPSLSFTIKVFDHDKLSSDDFEGQIIFNLSDLSSGEMFSGWYHLHDESDLTSIPPTHTASNPSSKAFKRGRLHIRIQYVNGPPKEFPTAQIKKWTQRYKSFRNLFAGNEPSIVTLAAICCSADTSHIHILSEHVLNLFSILNMPSNIFGTSPNPSPSTSPRSSNSSFFLDIFVRTLIRFETNQSSRLETLFRGNPFLTSFLVKLSRGRSFVRQCLESTLKTLLIKETTKLEVDPVKMKALNPQSTQTEIDALIKTNQSKLLYYTSTIVSKVLKVLSNNTKVGAHMPYSLRIVCHYLVEIVGSKLKGSRDIVLAGYIFLRLLCPCLITPVASGIVHEIHVGPIQRRNLILIAKIIQNLANQHLFEKQTFMLFANDFLSSNFKKLSEAFDIVSHPDMKPSSHILPVAYEGTDIELFRTFVGLHTEFKSLLFTPKYKTAVEKNLPLCLCASLQEKFSFLQNLSGSQSHSKVPGVPAWLHDSYAQIQDLLSKWPEPPKSIRILPHSLTDSVIVSQNVIPLSKHRKP